MTYIQPLTFSCLMLLLAGLIYMRRTKRIWLAATGLFVTFLLTWPPVDWLLSRPLESGYPVQPFPSGNAQAIVVLSSSIDAARYERPYVLPDEDTYRRCEHAAWLYKSWKALPVLASGGTHSKRRPPVAAIMRELLARAGVPDNNILVEDASLSTYENALFSTAILRRQGITHIALVVEASSMPRAIAAFERQGIQATPAPCSFRRLGTLLTEVIPSWTSLRRNEGTLHEVLGLMWYKMRGRI
jgi:uncharacterized SAM-binding protein YcdF (DUF218 family)